MTPEQIEQARDAVCTLNNITHATIDQVMDALTGTVFSEREAKEIRDAL